MGMRKTEMIRQKDESSIYLVFGEGQNFMTSTRLRFVLFFGKLGSDRRNR